MEQMTTRIGIEPGLGLVGRFGDTVIVIPRGEAAADSDEAAQELLDLAAAVGSDRQAPAGTIAGRLAAWVIGHMAGDVLAFGIVAPMRDGVVMFLRGAVWCTITEGGSTREVSGEQALTWVDQIVPGTFEQLAIGGAAGRPVQADPLSDLQAGVVPGQGFVLTRAMGTPDLEPAAAAAARSGPGPASGPEPASVRSREPSSGNRPPLQPGRTRARTGLHPPGRLRSGTGLLRGRERLRSGTRGSGAARTGIGTISRPCWYRPARMPRRTTGTPPAGRPGAADPGQPAGLTWWCRRPAPR